MSKADEAHDGGEWIDPIASASRCEGRVAVRGPSDLFSFLRLASQMLKAN